MPECTFSETQFSFCFTFEFIQKYSSWALLPFFPSTYLEGQPGFGYDVRVDQHLYFQFKRPFLVTRRRRPNLAQWDTFRRSYLRAHVDTNDEQHKLLKQLKSPTNEVFYITPEFNQQGDLSLHYHNQRIVENSLVISLDDLPNHGSGRHHLCYLPGGTFAVLFSEPNEIPKSNISKIMELSKNRENQSLTLVEEAQRVFSILSEYNLPKPLFINQPESQPELVNYVKNLLLSQFNVLWTPLISENQYWR